ncbi:MAG: DUF4330 family protein [Oscillospiraceae bacterium]
MKVVDEKGKLFGKLNIIDLLVIILIIAAVIVVGVKVLGGGDDAGASTTRLTYTVRVTAQDAELVDRVAEYVNTATSTKDQLMAGGNLLNAYVVDYWTEPTRYNRMSSGSVEFYDEETAAAAGLVDICFVIEANVANTVTNEVGTQEVRIGKTHIVKTTHMEFSGGVIESCTWESAS